MSTTTSAEAGLQQQQQQKPAKKPRLKTKLADAADYVSDRRNKNGSNHDSGGEEDLSELVFIKKDDPPPPSVTRSDQQGPVFPMVTFNNTKVYYRCTTCGRLVTSMGNRKHKLRLHLRSKYHRLRAKAAAEALDTDLVRIVANLRANNVHCLELRGGGASRLNGVGGGGGDDAIATPKTTPIQLYCTFCEAELVTRKSSNIRRHLESRAHRRSAQLVAEYVPMDSTTFHFELLQWLVDCEISVDKLAAMRPFLERHCRRRILEPATLKRDFLPYVLAVNPGTAAANATLENGTAETETTSGTIGALATTTTFEQNSLELLPKGPLKKRAVLWLRGKNEQRMREAQEAEAAAAVAKVAKKMRGSKAGVKAGSAARGVLAAKRAAAAAEKRKLAVEEGTESGGGGMASATLAATAATTSIVLKTGEIVGEDGQKLEAMEVTEEEEEDANAVMAILEEGVDYEVVHVEQVSEGVTRALIQERHHHPHQHQQQHHLLTVEHHEQIHQVQEGTVGELVLAAEHQHQHHQQVVEEEVEVVAVAEEEVEANLKPLSLVASSSPPPPSVTYHTFQSLPPITIIPHSSPSSSSEVTKPKYDRSAAAKKAKC